MFRLGACTSNRWQKLSWAVALPLRGAPAKSFPRIELGDKAYLRRRAWELFLKTAMEYLMFAPQTVMAKR